MTPDLRLRVNGRDYGGWESVRVTRGIEAISGSFELSLSDRWAGQSERWPIREEDVCAVLIGGTRVLLGYVDKRSISIGKEDRSLTVSGRDRAAAMVDCSAFIGKWEFLNVSFLALAQHLAGPFGMTVKIQAGLTPPKPLPKVTIDPGDSAFDVLERACRTAGVLPVSDGEGGIVLTRAGSARAATSLVEGENIVSASAEFDATGRFACYVVMGQNQGSEEFAGESAASVRGEARDEGVARPDRVLVVRPEGNVTPEHAGRRAAWEAKVRAARAASVSVTVQGWLQGDGSIWPINARVPIRSPSLGIDGEMLITQATHTLDGNGSTTVLALKRPDAFIPEPVVRKEGAWKELS